MNSSFTGVQMMGQAKLRGTPEVRKNEAIERKRIEDERVLEAKKLTKHNTKPIIADVDQSLDQSSMRSMRHRALMLAFAESLKQPGNKSPIFNTTDDDIINPLGE
jgi:hypothetical protein